jgi:Protein of unknown function (DUF732)
VKWIISGIVLASAALLGAAPAQADSYSFISSLRAHGFSNIIGGNSAMLSQGFWVCDQLKQGYTRQQIANSFMWSNDVTIESAADFVWIATAELCS